MVNHDQQLDELFGKYRAACPDVDASANFMPQVWAKIEARRKSEQWFFRWANSFAGATAVLVVVLSVLLYQVPKPLPQRAYIEKLTDEINEDYFLDVATVAKVQPASWSER
jgi:hypothetical protein